MCHRRRAQDFLANDLFPRLRRGDLHNRSQQGVAVVGVARPRAWGLDEWRCQNHPHGFSAVLHALGGVPGRIAESSGVCQQLMDRDGPLVGRRIWEKTRQGVVHMECAALS